MPELKTRKLVERGAANGRAPLQQAKMIGQQVQSTALHAKESVERGVGPTEQSGNTPEEYAADRIAGSASGAAVGMAYGFDCAGRQGVRDTYANAQAAKAQFQKVRQRKMLEHSVGRERGAVPDFPMQERPMSDLSRPDSARSAANRAAAPFRARGQGDKTAVRRLGDSARKRKLPPSPKTARIPHSTLSAVRSASQAAQKAHAIKKMQAAFVRTKAAAQAAAKGVKALAKASM